MAEIAVVLTLSFVIFIVYRLGHNHGYQKCYDDLVKQKYNKR